MKNKEEAAPCAAWCDWKVYVLLLAYITAVLLFLSIDSPLHDVYNRIDSAWFFMCGKAVMNGLTPYVDFTDSKGPLLWLIYGTGYLLSPRNYVGVWVLSCFVYAGTLFYNYKTARLLLGDERKALLAALLMPLAYFLPWFHYEIRAEDFCNLPVAVSVYYLFRLLYGCGSAAAQPTGAATRPTVRRYGLVLGGCFMALVLVKYSIAVMQGSMIVIALWYLMWEKQEYGLLKWTLCGMAAVALPFVVWLVAAGAWSGFIDEYFVNTFSTVSSDNGFLSTLITEFEEQWSTPQSQALLLLTTLGAWLLSRTLTHYRYVPLAVSLFFFLVCTRHNMNYYYAACYIFLIYLLIHVMSLLRKPVRTWGLAMAGAVVLMWSASEIIRNNSYKRLTTKWAVNNYRDSYERISRCIVGEKPRIINLLAGEHGFGMEHETLPAGRYWSRQVDDTESMVRGHVGLVESGNADYIIAYDYQHCHRVGLTSEAIMSCGYTICDSLTYVDYKGKNVTTIVYRRSEK